MPNTDELTLERAEIYSLAAELRYRASLNFTNLANKRAVAKAAKELGIKTQSRTAHGSLLDPRYTVEGRQIPDKGLANNYKQYQPKLYCLEGADRW